MWFFRDRWLNNFYKPNVKKLSLLISDEKNGKFYKKRDDQDSRKKEKNIKKMTWINEKG